MKFVVWSVFWRSYDKCRHYPSSPSWHYPLSVKFERSASNHIRISSKYLCRLYSSVCVHLQKSGWFEADSLSFLRLNYSGSKEEGLACNVQYLRNQASIVPSWLSRTWTFTSNDDCLLTHGGSLLCNPLGTQVHTEPQMELIYDPLFFILEKWSVLSTVLSK